MNNEFSFILNMEHSPWLTYDMKGWEPLYLGKTPMLVKKGAYLFDQQHRPNEVFLIQSGRVCIFTSHPNGTEKHHIVAERGSLLGTPALLRQCVHSVTARTVSDCVVYSISAQDFSNTLQSSHQIAVHLSGFLAEVDLTLMEHLYMQSFARPYSRVLISLINMAKQHGSKTDSGTRIGVKFTHEELANLINTSRVTVSNIFAELVREGLIKKQSGHYVILNMDRLTKMAVAQVDEKV